MMQPFEVDTALRMGTVFEVSGSSLKAALSPGLDELSRLHRGRVYAIGTIGSLIKIHVGRRLLFGMIRALRLQTEEEAAAVAVLDAERRVLEADLVGEGQWASDEQQLTFLRGLGTSALPMQRFIFSQTRRRATYMAPLNEPEREILKPALRLGTMLGHGSLNAGPISTECSVSTARYSVQLARVNRPQLLRFCGPFSSTKSGTARCTRISSLSIRTGSTGERLTTAAVSIVRTIPWDVTTMSPERNCSFRTGL